MIWWIDVSIGGALVLGAFLRYRHRTVVPLLKCSTYLRGEKSE